MSVKKNVVKPVSSYACHYEGMDDCLLSGRNSGRCLGPNMMQDTFWQGTCPYFYHCPYYHGNK